MSEKNFWQRRMASVRCADWTVIAQVWIMIIVVVTCVRYCAPGATDWRGLLIIGAVIVTLTAISLFGDFLHTGRDTK